VSVTAVAFVVTSCLYAGFQWTIRLIVYPQMARVPAASFARYETAHQRLVSYAVGPLFAGLGLSVLALLVDPPVSTPGWPPVLAVVLVAGILGITAFAAVPLHGRLAQGFDARTHARLLVVDTARLVVAAAAAALAVVVLMSTGRTG
jgi:hypothetical protein